MADLPEVSRSARLGEFKRRLLAAPAASNFDEAFGQIADILNAVEDEMTSIPFDPAAWRIDGRLYPPQRDSERADPGRPGVRRFRSAGHSTFLGENGSIVIQALSGELFLTKPGSDGRTL